MALSSTDPHRSGGRSGESGPLPPVAPKIRDRSKLRSLGETTPGGLEEETPATRLEPVTPVPPVPSKRIDGIRRAEIRLGTAMANEKQVERLPSVPPPLVQNPKTAEPPPIRQVSRREASPTDKAILATILLAGIVWFFIATPLLNTKQSGAYSSTQATPSVTTPVAEPTPEGRATVVSPPTSSPASATSEESTFSIGSNPSTQVEEERVGLFKELDAIRDHLKREVARRDEEYETLQQWYLRGVTEEERELYQVRMEQFRDFELSLERQINEYNAMKSKLSLLEP